MSLRGASTYLHCRVKLRTNSGHGLAVFVQEMDLGCEREESLSFRVRYDHRRRSGLAGAFSDPLCGMANSTGADFLDRRTAFHRWQFFNESERDLEVEFKATSSGNGSFLLVVTPTLSECESDGVRSLLYFRCGSGYCVDKNLVCDGRANCMEEPGFEAKDELLEECKKEEGGLVVEVNSESNFLTKQSGPHKNLKSY